MLSIHLGIKISYFIFLPARGREKSLRSTQRPSSRSDRDRPSSSIGRRESSRERSLERSFRDDSATRLDRPGEPRRPLGLFATGGTLSTSGVDGKLSLTTGQKLVAPWSWDTGGPIPPAHSLLKGSSMGRTDRSGSPFSKGYSAEQQYAASSMYGGSVMQSAQQASGVMGGAQMMRVVWVWVESQVVHRACQQQPSNRRCTPSARRGTPTYSSARTASLHDQPIPLCGSAQRAATRSNPYLLQLVPYRSLSLVE